MGADLAVQDKVRRLAEEFKERYGRLDVLVNNAGLVLSERTETPDGVETRLAINHLAPFLLTNLLLDLLKRSAPNRIVTVSSDAHRWGKMDLDDLQSRKRYRAFAVEGMTDKYLVDRKVKAASDAAYDETTRKELWEASEVLTGLKVPA